MKPLLTRFAVLLLLTLISPVAHRVSAEEALAAKHTFAIGDREFLLDEKPFVIRCGEIHFPRVPREYWQHRLQMAKAMGLNTVCVYLFWNYHEWQEGQFDWSGTADAAEFCRLAQKEGLWVILRPGPYSCAEWEMGGLPWWLLKKDGIRLRTSDPQFLEPATRYLKEVARVLGPLQITSGGPLLMVQVENEYGSFGADAAYLGQLRQALRDGGFNVPLFACNPPGAIGNGFRDDLFQVVNFGANPKGAFEALRSFQKTGPLMNGEFYPGWFDMWGRKHRTGDVDQYIRDLDYMLQNRESFSIYMAHGGTTWGLWSGADRPFQPDTTSYDYDAPISEAGWVTEKFTRTRELFAKYLNPGETLPPPPPANSLITVDKFSLTETAPVLANLPAPIRDQVPRTMEAYNQSRGCIVYRTTLAAGPAGWLSAAEVHDFAWVFLDGKPVGVMDRRRKGDRIQLPARTAETRLEVLVEAMGRVNFGSEVFDQKGIFAPVEFATTDGSREELRNWEVSSLPLDAPELTALKFKPGGASGPAFWRGTFQVESLGDTFLDLRSWGHGVTWVNGHCLGRFWNIGPTQTMYLPGPWLKPGANEIIVLDLLGPEDPVIAGLTEPILDAVRAELDFSRRARAEGTLQLPAGDPAAQGSFTADARWQEMRFTQAVKGRYLCFEALSSLDEKPTAALAELDATNAKGNVFSKSEWKILWVSSEEVAAGSGEAENILDGQPNTCWQSEYSPQKPGYPHRIVIDLGASQVIGGLRCLPASGQPEEAGRVKDYRVFVSDQPFGLSTTP